MACLTSVNVSRLWLVPVCVRRAPFDFRLCLQRGINYQVTARWIFNFAVLKSKKKFPPHFARRGKEISTSRDEFFRWWNYFSRSTSEGGRDVKVRYARSCGLSVGKIAAGLISIICSFHCSEGTSHDAVKLTFLLTCFGEHARNCFVRSRDNWTLKSQITIVLIVMTNGIPKWLARLGNRHLLRTSTLPQSIISIYSLAT